MNKINTYCLKDLNTIIVSVTDIQESILVSGDPLWVLQFSLSTAPPAKWGDECSRCVEYWHTVVPPLNNIDIVMVHMDTSWVRQFTWSTAMHPKCSQGNIESFWNPCSEVWVEFSHHFFNVTYITFGSLLVTQKFWAEVFGVNPVHFMVHSCVRSLDRPTLSSHPLRYA